MSCPDHYKLTTLFRKDGSPAEVIDICDELAPDDPNQFQAIEYLLRCKRKGQLESDLEKCKFYIDRMLPRLKTSQIDPVVSCIDCKWLKQEGVRLHCYSGFDSKGGNVCINWKART